MKKKAILCFLLCFVMFVTACQNKNVEETPARPGFHTNTVLSEYPSYREESEGFDHAAFDAAIIAATLGNPASNEQTQNSAHAGNYMISPSSLYLALSSLAYLTDGTTRFQITRLLGVDKLSQLQSNVQTLWKGQFYQTSNTTSLMGSSLWMTYKLPFTQEAMAKISENYYTSCYYGMPDGSTLTNYYREWLSSMSGNLFGDELNEVTFPEEMLLTSSSTLFYKSAWKEGFPDSSFREHSFYTPTEEVYVYMMDMNKEYPYHQDVNFGAAGIELADGAMMWFLLPAEGVTPVDLAKDPGVLTWLNDPSYDQRLMSIHIPRFDVKSYTEFKDILPDLGITEVFKPKRSNFTGLTSDLKGCALSRIDQRVRLILYEDGLVSAPEPSQKAESLDRVPENTLEFFLNRPFMFALRDADGTLIYIGIINDPTK